MIINEYFTIENTNREENNVVFSLLLNPDYKVYKGHFPDMPVCPGVCNIQMIKECLECETGKKLLLDTISQCKFSSVVTPLENKYLQLNMQIVETEEKTYKVKANVTNRDNTITFIDFKGEFINLNY